MTGDMVRDELSIIRARAEAIHEVDFDAMTPANRSLVEAVFGDSARMVGELWANWPGLTVPESVNQEAHRIINGARRDDYGDVRESFEQIASLWSIVLGHEVTARQVAVCMMQLKVSRLLHGWQRDSALDICGYAGCLEKLGFDG